MSEYRLTRLRGEWAATWNDAAGKRHRVTLGTSNHKEAERLLKRHKIANEKPAHVTVAYLWELYRAENALKRIAGNMVFSGKAILPEFGSERPDEITVAACRSYISKRQNIGRKDGTIWTELNHLQVVLNWAHKHRHISSQIVLKRPEKPAPKDRRLTKDEGQRLLDAASVPHVQLAIALMLATGARSGAIMDLTWDRVDFKAGLITYALRDSKTRKGRATVPMTNDLRKRLEEARKGSLSEYAVEWAGKPVRSLKRGFARAVAHAGLKGVTPHVLRHTAASWMAEDGVPMTEIAAVLGHSDSNTTERIYAKFSPSYLRRAIHSLEMSGVPSGTREPKVANADRTKVQ